MLFSKSRPSGPLKEMSMIRKSGLAQLIARSAVRRFFGLAADHHVGLAVHH